jgi:transcription elongation factor Elf1
MAAKLLNCPFCGSQADEEVLVDGSDISKVYCTNGECGAEISMVKNLLRCRQLWNSRQKSLEGVDLQSTNK